MSSRREFIGGGVAATAVTLAASASGRSRDGYRPGSLTVGVFVYESGQPLAIEAARVAAGQLLPVSAFDPARPGDAAGELARLVDSGAGAIAGLTSGAAFDLVSELAAARGWPLRHSAPAVGADLLHWVVAPAVAANG